MTSQQRNVPRLALNAARFEERQRLAMYEVANALVNLNADVQRTLSLRPDACHLYLLIAVATVQRYARAPGDDTHSGAEPLPPTLAGTISRRRLADASGLPRETVARHVRELMARGLVVEHGHGKLATPPGLLRTVMPTGVLDRMAGETMALANRLLRLGVLHLESRDDGGVGAEGSPPPPPPGS
jgi:biotin operon repressor